MADRFTTLLMGEPYPSTAKGAAGAPGTPGAPEVECPGMDIRNGASTLSMNAESRDPAATALRYQVSIVRMARQCSVVGTDLRVKAGVQGRVILGPAGGPGEIDVPLRYAVVAEGPEPQTIATKLYHVSVVIGPDQTSVPFTYVDDDLTFPMPKRASDLESYVIYVGFDPSAAKPPARKPPPKKRRPS